MSTSANGAGASSSVGIAPSPYSCAGGVVWVPEGVAPAAYADALLLERGKTHGDFRTTADNIQRIKNVMRDTGGWARLDQVQRECLDCIAIKVGRILSGDAGAADHWDDIAGYARLATTSR